MTLLDKNNDSRLSKNYTKSTNFCHSFVTLLIQYYSKLKIKKYTTFKEKGWMAFPQSLFK